MKSAFGPMAAGVGILTACATADVPGEGEGSSAIAELRDERGRTLAHAAARQTRRGIRVTLDAAALAPGSYGAHVHTIGRCDPPAFESAGPHWNPTGRRHGRQNPLGAHMGDLPNLVVDRGGRGRLAFRIDGARLHGPGGMLDTDGAAIVIHANADDGRTDPSGNSGARIACGALD